MTPEEYLKQFEKRVLIYGFEKGIFASTKEDPVAVRRGKLYGTPFGQFIGSSFEYEKVLAFDYYGMVKLSSSIKTILEEHEKIFPGIKLINAPIIYFSSILKEQVLYLAPDLLDGFSEFKNHLVASRWK